MPQQRHMCILPVTLRTHTPAAISYDSLPREENGIRKIVSRPEESAFEARPLLNADELVRQILASPETFRMTVAISPLPARISITAWVHSHKWGKIASAFGLSPIRIK